LLQVPGAHAAPAARAGAPLPSWAVGDAWSYHTDDKNLNAYPIVLIQVPDPKNPLISVDTVLCNYPTSRAIDDQYQVEAKGAFDINQTVWDNVTEPGTWMMRKLVAGQARCDAGDIVYQGTYNKTENNTGSQLLFATDLNGDGSLTNIYSWTEYQGDFYFIITIDGYHSTTVDKPCQEWKHGWDKSPMAVGDSWDMNCIETESYREHWASAGNLQGEFNDTGTYIYEYAVNWSVVAVASQTVMDDTFPEAYRVTGQGTVAWNWSDDKGHKSSGKDNVKSDKWYADQGTYWDAGWGISYDDQTFLVWSTYGPPIDWNKPPQLVKAPPSEVSVYVGEAWEFSDYTVTDTDPGACGSAGFVYFVNVSYGGGPILLAIEIDQFGVLTYTPVQTDAADGYTVKITVWDSCPGSAQSVAISFTLNVKNVNHPPTANPSIMTDLWLYEGENITTAWSIKDVFTDVDMQKSPLTGKPYDLQESLTYTVQNNGTMWVYIDLGTGNVTYTALDKHFPANQNFSLVFTATDRSGAKVSDGMVVHVMHVDHVPQALSKNEDSITIDEDSSTTRDFKSYFTDYDVDNSNYITSDRLYYYGWARANITVENKGNLFKMSPWSNWSGEETIHLRASDMWGGTAETTVELVVRPVNDLPKVYFQTPETKDLIDMDEPPDPNTGGGHDLPRTIVFSVTAMDIDDDNLLFNWTVQDVDTGDVYIWSKGSNMSMQTFRTAFQGDFMDGFFTGGADTKEYIVEVTVSDGKVTIKGGSWDILVHNVNRIPRIQGVGVEKNKNGVLTAVLDDSYGNYTLPYGGTYEITVNGLIYDADSALKDMNCKWDLDQGREIFTGRCNEMGAINLSTGQKKGSSLARMGTGDHILTLTVTDELGAQAGIALYFHVGKPPPTLIDNIVANQLYIAFAFGVIISMFFVGYYLAVLQAKWSKPLQPPAKVRVARAGGLGPTLPPKAPYIPKGGVPKKVVRKKVVAKTGPEVTQVGTLKIKKVTKPAPEEDIPEDWK